MFKDTKEELERLEEELLAEDETPADPGPKDDPAPYDFDAEPDLTDEDPDRTRVFRPVRPMPQGRAYNADRTDEDPEDISDELLDDTPRRSNGPLVVLAVIMTVCIVGLVVFWVLRLRGIL